MINNKLKISMNKWKNLFNLKNKMMRYKLYQRLNKTILKQKNLNNPLKFLQTIKNKTNCILPPNHWKNNLEIIPN